MDFLHSISQFTFLWVVIRWTVRKLRHCNLGILREESVSPSLWNWYLGLKRQYGCLKINLSKVSVNLPKASRDLTDNSINFLLKCECECVHVKEQRSKHKRKKKKDILNLQMLQRPHEHRHFAIHLQKALVLLSNNQVPPQTTWHLLVLWVGEVKFLFFSNNAGKEGLLRGWPMWYL